MKEIQVSICISGEGARVDTVNDALIDLCESKGWLMGGGVEEYKAQPIADWKKEFEEWTVSPTGLPRLVSKRGSLSVAIVCEEVAKWFEQNVIAPMQSQPPATETFFEDLEMHIISNEADWSRNPQAEFQAFKTSVIKTKGGGKMKYQIQVEFLGKHGPEKAWIQVSKKDYHFLSNSPRRIIEEETNPSPVNLDKLAKDAANEAYEKSDNQEWFKWDTYIRAWKDGATHILKQGGIK